MLEKMMEVTSDQNVRENLIKKASGLINQFDVQPVAEERNNHLQKLVQDLK